MSDNIDRTQGGGPWRLELDEALAPGEWQEYDLRNMTYRGRKGFFNPWLPLDSCMIKNLDTSNAVGVVYNGQFEAHVEPSAVDNYSDVQLTRIRVRNEGDTEIVPSDLVIQVSVEPYDADDHARREATRSPVEKIARSFIGL